MSTFIIIKHIPSGTTVSFLPFLTAFSDNFKSDWNQSFVMGRMDSIPTFKRTTRVINMSFDVPAASAVEAIQNLEDARKLANILYPVYKEIGGQAPAPTSRESAIPTPGYEDTQQKILQKQAEIRTLEAQLQARPVTVMSSSPIVSIEFSNLVQDAEGKALYGFLDGFNFKPDIEVGYFTDKCNELYPKSFSVDLTFNVIHTQLTGWPASDSSTTTTGPWKKKKQ